MAHQISCPCQMACEQENVKWSRWKHVARTVSSWRREGVPTRVSSPSWCPDTGTDIMPPSPWLRCVPTQWVGRPQALWCCCGRQEGHNKEADEDGLFSFVPNQLPGEVREGRYPVPGSWEPLRGPVMVSWAAVTKFHKLDSLKQQKCILPWNGGSKSEIKVPAGPWVLRGR